mmetsp:Transcript_25763/g.43422  ORF Transcript_25763/g.43422 Transcript_25763/m.43422 type:complete len:205 (-) Transcript_25763:726-1340(-)
MTPTHILRIASSSIVSRERNQLVATTTLKGGNQNIILVLVENIELQSARTSTNTRSGIGGSSTEGNKRNIASIGELVETQVSILDIKATQATMRIKRRSFTFKLKYSHATIVTSGQQILVRMSSQDPEAIRLTTESLNTLSLGNIPNTNSAILGIRHNKLVLRVKQYARDIVGVTAHSVNLPSLSLIHSPKLHLSVISTRHHQW